MSTPGLPPLCVEPRGLRAPRPGGRVLPWAQPQFCLHNLALGARTRGSNPGTTTCPLGGLGQAFAQTEMWGVWARGAGGGQGQAQSWAVLSCPLRWTLLSPGPCGQLPLDMDIKSNRKSFLSRGITGFHSSGRCRNAGCVCLGFVFFPRKTKQNKHRGACTLTHRADPRMLTLKPQPQHTTGAECGRLGSPL